MKPGSSFAPCRALTLCAALFFALSLPALAGPPFQTDDPEPTPYRFFEVYLASDYTRTFDTLAGTLPHLEINYGVAPNVQITATLPLAGSQESHSPMHFGYGDTEFEAKVCILHETDILPQISFAPAFDFPTGEAEMGLGAGYDKMFFPLWAEKGFGRYTVYGGGGLWRNPGTGNQNYSFSGLAVERDMSHGFTLGTEIFGQSADTLGGRGSMGFSVGMVKDLDEQHKVLFSVGRSISGESSFSGYGAYELFIGPRAKTSASEEEDVKS
jgi:hypothetical protein